MKLYCTSRVKTVVLWETDFFMSTNQEGTLSREKSGAASCVMYLKFSTTYSNVTHAANFIRLSGRGWKGIKDN